jgi:glyoxylate/hydroxypyruvate reductase A
MDILFASTVDDSAEWAAALAEHLPEARLRARPDIPDPAAIRYALVWQPEPGLLAGLPNLKAIFSLGAGVDGVLNDWQLPDGVPLVRMLDEGLTAGMVEYVAWQVLAWHRRSADYRAQQGAAVWRPRAHKLARERTVGILGLGVLGSAAAAALSGLGFRVLGWTRTPTPGPVDGVEAYAGRAEFGAMLAQCECLVCLLPLTSETRGILDRSAFALLPRGAYVINAARGGHLVADDLLAALRDGHIAGASLDVFEEEPLPAGHPFWHHPRIAITPHVASMTHPRTAARSVADNVRRIERGEPAIGVVDRARGY